MRPRKKSNKRYWIIASTLSAIVIIIGLFLWASSGNTGTIAVTDKKAVQSKPSFKKFNGQYVAFEYSSKYLPQTLEAKDYDKELYMFTADTAYDKRIAVAVSMLSGGQLMQSSAYALRKSDPDTYTLTDQIVDGSNAVLATKKDGLEHTVFLPRGDKIAVLSLTTTSTSDNIVDETQRLLSTFSWKQLP